MVPIDEKNRSVVVLSTQSRTKPLWFLSHWSNRGLRALDEISLLRFRPHKNRQHKTSKSTSMSVDVHKKLKAHTILEVHINFKVDTKLDFHSKLDLETIPHFHTKLSFYTKFNLHAKLDFHTRLAFHSNVDRLPHKTKRNFQTKLEFRLQKGNGSRLSVLLYQNNRKDGHKFYLRVAILHNVI